MPAPLVPLFPDGALRRGTTTTVAGLPGHGATTLALALLAAASQAGSWCAAVGLPDPGVVAAAELGIDLRRVVFVPHPGSGWAEAAGDLLPGVDVVLVRPPGRARGTAARHLSARARDRQAALVVLVEHVSDWPQGGDLALSVGDVEWAGDRPGPRSPAEEAGRGTGQWTTVGRPGHRVLALASRRLGGGGGDGGDGEDGEGRGRVCRGRSRQWARGGLSGAAWNWNGWSSSGAPTFSRRGRAGRRPGDSCRWSPAPERSVPGLHPIRLGVCALPARGPARFFGGEEMVVPAWSRPWGRMPTSGWPTGSSPPILAARSQLIVPAGEVRQFLAPWSVATLARPELAVTLQRLGVTTLGQFAALPAPARLGPFRRRRRGLSPPGGPGRERGTGRRPRSVHRATVAGGPG